MFPPPNEHSGCGWQTLSQRVSPHVPAPAAEHAERSSSPQDGELEMPFQISIQKFQMQA